MSHIINTICGAIGLTALAAGFGVAVHPGDVPSMSIPQFRLVQLQQLAETSCRCARRVGRNGAMECWAEFERRMPGADLDTMCEPSMHMRCAGKGILGGNDCVVMEYGLGNHSLCSKAEVSAMESVLYSELEATGGKGPFPKTESLYRDIVAGKPLPRLKRSGLCTSS